MVAEEKIPGLGGNCTRLQIHVIDFVLTSRAEYHRKKPNFSTGPSPPHKT